MVIQIVGLILFWEIARLLWRDAGQV